MDCWEWNNCLTYYSEYLMDWNKAVTSCGSGGRYTNKGRVICATCVAQKNSAVVDPKDAAGWKRLPKDVSQLERVQPWTWPIWTEQFPPPPYSKGGRSTLGMTRADLGPPGLPGTAATLSSTSELLATAGIRPVASLSSTGGPLPTAGLRSTSTPPMPKGIQPWSWTNEPQSEQGIIHAPGLEFVQSGPAWSGAACSASDSASASASASDVAPSPANVPVKINWYKKELDAAGPPSRAEQPPPPQVPPPPPQVPPPPQAPRPPQPSQAEPAPPQGRPLQRQKVNHGKIGDSLWAGSAASRDIRVGQPGITETIHVPGQAPIIVPGPASAGTTPKASSAAASKSSGSPKAGPAQYTHN
jgi:hypothetical protein